MRRWRVWLALGAACWLLAGIACARKPASRTIPEPPLAVAGGWQRASLGQPGLETTPEGLRAYHPQERVQTIYRSYSSTVLVDIYRLPGEATALEAMQKWRNEPGVVAFQRGSLFVVCSSAVEPTQGLIDFSGKLEKEWLGMAR